MSETDRMRWAALYVLCAGTLMIVLDGSIVTVALPTIASALHFSQTGLSWLVNAYMIAFGGLLLLSGRFGDLIGRKRMFLTGVTTFTAASLLCGLSGSQELLITGRFLQGVGGAMASAVTLGMIVTMFTEHREQAKAIGVFSFVAAAGGSIGVIAGGVLTQAAGWNSIFYINVPIGIAIVALAARLFQPHRGLGSSAGADLLGAFLVTSGLMLLVYTINKAEEHGWGSAHTLGFGTVSIALLAGFVLRQTKASSPLLPLRLFRSRQLWGANVVQILFVAALFGFQFLLALYLQSVNGYSAVETGLAYLPGPIVIAVISLGLSARIMTRFGGRTVLLAGLVSTVAALLLLARLPLHATYAVDVLPAVVLLGVGAGLALPAVIGLAMSGATPSDSGLASGLLNTTQQIGGALGVAALATLASSHAQSLLSDGESATAASTYGYRLAFGVAAGLLIAAFLLTATVLSASKALPPQPSEGGTPSDVTDALASARSSVGEIPQGPDGGTIARADNGGAGQARLERS
ncbi:MFS transporter [Nonomuraea sp. NEAU-A123]|uniref:MFS transporter n=1 Tax=Nonomuraea sp. NEAU-A123 TaxID=2839649 RepID=UPI001BE4E182|nr:MFS transporter [Nonomuraea sp. NEAU-A123]MBT2225084.1 MFS transporter [Nonomuraea sp. NEAU-A123]